MSDGHVSYHESEEMRKNVTDANLGITRFEHNNMRPVLNKNWEFNTIPQAIIDGISKNPDQEVTMLNEKWIPVEDKNQRVYHSPLGNGSDIVKLISTSGREIIVHKKTKTIIKDSNLKGTFNYSTSDLHVTEDVFPYWIWKNDAKDNSNIFTRIHPILGK